MLRKVLHLSSLTALAQSLAACRGAAHVAREAPVSGYEVVASWPHDPDAFTQGLLYRDGALYESTGLVGRSSVRVVELETGRVVRQHDVPAPLFAEGLALVEGRLHQLTWQSERGFVYDAATLQPAGEFAYTGEGWGLTDDGTSLIMSDGSAMLRFLDPATHATQRTVTVTDAGRPVERLNELEYVRGEVWANVWLTDRIARIDPATGRVTGWVDLAGLLAPGERTGEEDVLNGIAYDAAGDRLLVTGKLWPRLFHIRVLPP